VVGVRLCCWLPSTGLADEYAAGGLVDQDGPQTQDDPEQIDAGEHFIVIALRRGFLIEQIALHLPTAAQHFVTGREGWSLVEQRTEAGEMVAWPVAEAVLRAQGDDGFVLHPKVIELMRVVGIEADPGLDLDVIETRGPGPRDVQGGREQESRG